MSADSDEQGFLARWSRRKREVAAESAAPPQPVPASALPVPVDPAPEPEPEMVEPPALDLVDKDFDMAHWLKQPVPESWKLAALRRAWESDPAIAGFENPARDYALDWNTPGGAPGYGPLTESDDVEAMIRKIFGDAPPPEAENAVEEAQSSDGDSMPHHLSLKTEADETETAAQQNPEVLAQDRHLRLTGPGPESANYGKIVPNSPEATFAAVQNTASPAAPPLRHRKRGGGAIPG